MQIDFWEKAVRDALAKKCDEIGQEEAEKAVERTKQRIKEMLPAICVGVFKHFEVGVMRDRLEIRVRMEDKTK
jgi:hypothetical protein